MAKEGSGRSEPKKNSPRLVGWREWMAFPELGIEAVKAKLDTGARTSALHAWDVMPFTKAGADWVRFVVYPDQRHRTNPVTCEAPVKDRRRVTNSGGRSEMRYVIETSLQADGETWSIELGLTNRDDMGFRLLIGREAMRGRLLIDPNSSFRLGRRIRPKKTPKKKPLTKTPSGRALPHVPTSNAEEE